MSANDDELVYDCTELVEDEYLHKHNKSGIVHIFTSEREKNNGNKIKQTLQELKYIIEDAHIHPINSLKEVEKDLQSIQDSSQEETSCVILIFFGRIKDQVQRGYVLTDKTQEKINLRDVWSKFITCESLRGKPKIFIFQTTVDPGVTVDSVVRDKSYFYFPNEADLFIVYNHNHEPDNNSFIKNLSQNICKFGKSIDIANLLTHCNTNDQQALQISTLTKKFYFDHDVHRGYFNQINEIKTLKNQIEKIERKVKTIYKSKGCHSSLPSLETDDDDNLPIKPKERRQSESFRPRINSKGKKPDRPVWRP